ncbi:head maturation protease, ClpP-related [Polycladidibacter hongkongensis]|uniref:head maturation protease, ClpP-related n=1 Tax=Polycladidibacter hongkongensis TaxID=1647556 RepID=UPI0008335E58|nr:head maturation protease, ClpP-related [Pseudovibrio hongkongensis]
MNIYRDGQLYLYGFVGDSFWESGFTSTQVIEALAEHGREEDLTVRMDSGGGYAMEGLSIYNALSAHKGKVTVQVDAMSASAASLIAMAADEVVMMPGSLMMIHDPAGITWGTAEDHEDTANLLNLQAEEFAGIYAAASEKSVDDVRELMKAETWMNGKKAVDEGFATSSKDGKSRTTACSPFNFTMYANAPKRLMQMAQRKNWTNEPGPQASQPLDTEDSEMKPEELEKIKMEAKEAGVKEGAAAFMKLHKEVMALPEAIAQPKLAEHLMEQGLEFDAIKATLETLEKQTDSEATADNNQSADEAYTQMRQAGAGLGGTSAPQKPRMSRGDVFEARRKLMRAA